MGIGRLHERYTLTGFLAFHYRDNCHYVKWEILYLLLFLPGVTDFQDRLPRYRDSESRQLLLERR